MQLAIIIPLDGATAVQLPIYHPGHPDHGLPSHGHADNSLPGVPPHISGHPIPTPPETPEPPAEFEGSVVVAVWHPDTEQWKFYAAPPRAQPK